MDMTWDHQQEVLHSPFSIEEHKNTFIHYLEVIIHPDGFIEYAVPSHVMKLRDIAKMTSESMFEEWYESGAIRTSEPTEWLCEKTGCISVWEKGYMGKANEKQREVLQLLKDHDLYEGGI